MQIQPTEWMLVLDFEGGLMGVYKESTAVTRQNIMDAFWVLYCERRIEKITVREIMAKAGYNRGTFYEYFLDVYDVLDQIENSLLPELSDMPPLLLEKSGELLPMDSFIKLYSSSSKYYSVLLGDYGDPAFAGKIKKGIKDKIMEQLDKDEKDIMEMDYTLEYMLSAMIGILTYWFLHEEDMEKERLIRLMYKLMSSEGIQELAQKIQV